jgi:hypothetical protein
MEVIPQQLGRLADVCLTASQRVTDDWNGAQGGLTVGGYAAGNTSGATGLLAAHQAAADAAGVALGRVSGVLEKDMDALLQCAFDVTTTDEAAAADLEGTGSLLPGLPFGLGA